MVFWIDRSTQSLALRAPSRKWAKCARPPLWPARHPFFSPCTSAGAAAHWAGVCTAGRDRHRPRRLNSTYYVAAREIGTRTDRARWTRRSGTSRGIAVLDGLGYFVFLLMRRSSSCRQRLAVAAPAAIAHPKQDVNTRLRISTRIHHARCATARAARGGLAGCEYWPSGRGVGKASGGPRARRDAPLLATRGGRGSALGRKYDFL